MAEWSKLCQTLYGSQLCCQPPQTTGWVGYARCSVAPLLAAMLLIDKGVTSISPPPEETLRQVAKLLGADVTVRVRLIAAVGDFEWKAYTFPDRNWIPTTAVEVDDPKAGQVSPKIRRRQSRHFGLLRGAQIRAICGTSRHPRNLRVIVQDFLVSTTRGTMNSVLSG